MQFLKGDTVILYIKEDGEFKPIGCLTSNNINETVEMLPTSTREGDGWKTSIPTTQDMTIDFEGFQPLDSTNVLGYLDLKIKKRNRERIEWRVASTQTSYVEEGFGYINNIGDANNVGELMSFSGSIQNYGMPSIIQTLLDLFQNGNGFLFQNGNGMQFN